jgi:hypothetical protein
VYLLHKQIIRRENMKKIASFAVIGIISCVLTISQAYAGYNIVWWGDSSGSISTTETARTEQASIELFSQLFTPWDLLPDLAPYPEGTCFAAFYEGCYYKVPDNCVGYFAEGGMDNAVERFKVCESGTWTDTFSSSMFPNFFRSGSWDVFLDDADNDGIDDDTDNCPDLANPNQEDADSDGIGDACDENTIYGTISGEVQEGVTVNIYILSCGIPQPHADVITDAQGYYAIGGLPNSRYLVGPENAGYSFSLSYWVDIPQTEIQSYDFTAIED